ncbi:MAG: hypothetical protein SGJ09_16880 [Phycisphaerae bacterium]|nr:hypothetical protein [Phycisphaerae bacterium]
MTPRRSLSSVSSISPLASRLLLCATTVLPFVVSAVGCKDADVEAKVAAERDFKEQTRAYMTKVESTTTTERNARAAEIETLAAKTAAIGASIDQKASAGLLAASMFETAASFHLASARDLEIADERARTLIANAAAAAATLQALADAQSQLSLGGDRDFLKAQKSIAEAALQRLQTDVKELEGPIAQLKVSIADRRDKLTVMQTKADGLRREANAVSAFAGFPFVEEAANVKSNAAQLRASVSLDELQLFAMQPELDQANNRLNAANAISKASDTALAALENYASTLSGDAAGLKQTADGLRAAAQAALEALVSSRDGVLNETYENASSLLQKAVEGAGRTSSSSREMAAAGAQAKLDANTTLGALGAAQAAGVAGQIALLKQLAAAGTLFGGEAKQKDATDALKAKREEVVTAAKEHYATALEALGSMNLEAPATARTKAAIETSVSLLEGRAAVPDANADAARTAGGGAGSRASAGASAAALVGLGGGFPSVDELVAAFAASSADPKNSATLAKRAFAFSSTEYRSLFELTAGLGESMLPLLSALHTKFGPEGMTKFLGAAGQANSMSSWSQGFEKVEKNGKTFLRSSNGGTTVELEAVQAGGAWFANGDGLYAGLDPSMLAQATMGLQMMGGMRDALGAAASSIAGSVSDGTIATPEDAFTAFQMEMMKAMQGG